MLTFSTPFIPAFCPLVPQASSGVRGLFSQASAPCGEEMRRMNVVVLNKGHVARKAIVRSYRIDLMDQMLAVVICGVGLAGENDLYWPPQVQQDLTDALDIVKDQAMRACSP